MEPSADSETKLAQVSPRSMVGGLAAAMVVANIAGALLYLWRASFSWAIPEERAAGITTVTGEPFIWALGVLPVWGAFALVNLAWVVLTLIRREAWRRSAAAGLVVFSCWFVAFWIDFAHH
jgi:hypothetical protein